MNSLSFVFGTSQSQLPRIDAHYWHHSCPPISCSIRNQNPANRRSHAAKSKLKFKPKPSSSASDRNLHIVIDPAYLSHQVSSSIQQLFCASHSKFRHFVFSSKEAFEDLQTMVSIDRDRRVVISCRRSTLEFVSYLILWCCAIVLAFRVFGNLRVGFWSRFELGYGALVRRDRSLAGREVVVGKNKKNKGFWVMGNPLSPARGTVPVISERLPMKRARMEEKLPGWWPVSLPSPVMTGNKEEHQREANRLIRAIMERRMSGKDILEDDIVQLRQICRKSGARVSFDTTNTRDSFYRLSVEFVLNLCSRATVPSSFVQIDGEDACQFVAGLADSIGIEHIRAARIVSAGVAARTRSCFLQAWALQMQGRSSEAVAELSKICLIHHPEMEMVALGLEKHLKVDQRESLMNMLVRTCGENCHRSAAEALGLVRDTNYENGVSKNGGKIVHISHSLAPRWHVGALCILSSLFFWVYVLTISVPVP
ncbi:uncharacterized protein LOC131150543 isoform X3 [Malania oleifera]|uniref:uncharacterized protein LOC131150543 isoform X3 n=1 Tax=Malania oleifera TaxID=397392 RepID=UPI0025ADEF48|nr:uncharacterized protein LOC131150543 isoform X3 [Malania oleifera]